MTPGSQPANIVSFLSDPSTSPGFTASYSYTFTKLVQAATTADLASTLEMSSGLTLFAPTDAAFDRLYAALGTTDVSQDKLMDILKYHVLSRVFTSPAITSASSYPIQVETLLSGKLLSISVNSGSVMINLVARVLVADIMTANNCVVHVIDSVLDVDSAPTTPGMAPTAIVPVSQPANIVSFLQNPPPSPQFSYTFTK